MDKRKAANGTETPENDERAMKRRKLAEDYDLHKGESPESTTAYGLSFLDQIRRTSDKNGRKVATYFEELPPKAGNTEYYKRTRMPISLGMVEQKLKDGEFKDMSELEGYLKRMIQNAKEFYPRTSSTFDDAERVRKAVSNYMTKTNPAYQKRGYQAVAAPLPPEGDEATEDSKAGEVSKPDDEKEEEEAATPAADEEAVIDEADTGRGTRKRSIILKRRGSTRTKQAPPTNTPRRASARFDHSQVKEKPEEKEVEEEEEEQDEDEEDTEQDKEEKGEAEEKKPRPATGEGYKGLTFQQAQEKIVDDLLVHTEPEYDSPYFEPFLNLPPRQLKDYYRMIQEPISVKKLQRMVKGIFGRHQESTGISEFKTWAQFEEKAKLLWTNAYYYNEEGSEIYELAQELEKHVMDQLKQATAVIADPAPPKIKLKVGGSTADQPTPSKKITIHVGSGRGASTDALTPLTRDSVDTPSVNGVNGAPAAAASADGGRSESAAAASPRPSVPPTQEGPAGAASPAVRPPSAASGQGTPALPTAPPAPVVPPAPVIPMEQKHPRAPGKGAVDALISNIRFFASHYANQSENPVMITVMPDEHDMQQSVTVNVPPTHTRVGLITRLPETLQDRQYSLWTLLDKQPLQPNQQIHPGQHSSERIFEAALHPGLNVIESHLVAAIPRADRIPGGPETELEIFTIYVNVMRY